MPHEAPPRTHLFWPDPGPLFPAGGSTPIVAQKPTMKMANTVA